VTDGRTDTLRQQRGAGVARVKTKVVWFVSAHDDDCSLVFATLLLLQAFDEATREDGADVNSNTKSSGCGGSQRLVLGSAPLPLTEAVTTQPFNRDRFAFEYHSPDGWLY